MNGRPGKATMNVLALALVVVFALMCAAMMLMGVKAYRAVTESTQRRNEKRTAVGYVMNRIHAAQTVRIETVEIDGAARCVMIFPENIDGQAYETRLFCADGALREQFCRADVPLVSALDGAEMARLEDFAARQDGRLLTMDFAHPDGTNSRMHAACVEEGSAR